MSFLFSILKILNYITYQILSSTKITFKVYVSIFFKITTNITEHPGCLYSHYCFSSFFPALLKLNLKEVTVINYGREFTKPIIFNLPYTLRFHFFDTFLLFLPLVTISRDSCHSSYVVSFFSLKYFSKGECAPLDTITTSVMLYLTTLTRSTVFLSSLFLKMMTTYSPIFLLIFCFFSEVNKDKKTVHLTFCISLKPIPGTGKWWVFKENLNQ